MPSLEPHRASEILVDDTYQRNIVRDHVMSIVRNFDPAGLGVITVSRRGDGSLWVLDGQHRLSALHEMGRQDEPVMCLVYDGLTAAEEANRFAFQARSLRIHPVYLYNARLVAGDPETLAINEIVTSFGLEVTVNKRAGNIIQAPTTLHNIFKSGGRERLERVLLIAGSIWSHDRIPIPSYLIQGVDSILLRYPSISEERLIEMIRATPPEDIDAAARAARRYFSDRSSGIYGRVFREIYNKGLRKNKLPEWDSSLMASGRDGTGRFLGRNADAPERQAV